MEQYVIDAVELLKRLIATPSRRKARYRQAAAYSDFS